MAKKSFKDNPAMAFISQRKSDMTHDETQDNTQYSEQEHPQQETHYSVSSDTKEILPRQGYIRTQGRKGHKKPRINLAFDSDALLEKVRNQAEKEGKSITQLMNEAIIIYLNNIQ